jgi:flavorubredoxin
MLPPLEKFFESLANANVKAKIGAAFGSCGWSVEDEETIFDLISHKPHPEDLQTAIEQY